MVNLKKHHGWGALAATIIYAAGYGTSQMSQPPSCAEIDAGYMPLALSLAREYSKTAKSQLVFVDKDPDVSMYFESSKLEPADITDIKLEALKGLYDRAANLERNIRDTEQTASCLLSKSTTTNMYVYTEIRDLLKEIFGRISVEPESFRHLKKYRIDSTTPAPPENDTPAQDIPPHMPLPEPRQPEPIIA